MKLFTLEVLAALEAELISRFGADAPQNIAVLNQVKEENGANGLALAEPLVQEGKEIITNLV